MRFQVLAPNVLSSSCTKCAFKFLHQMCFQVLAPMESTGVWAQELKAHYWIAPQEVLERHGLDVLLVNTRVLANVLSNSCTKSTRTEKDGPGGLYNVLSTLAPVDPTSAQLRFADGFVPAAGTGMHVAHTGTRQKDQCAFKFLHRWWPKQMRFQLLHRRTGCGGCRKVWIR